MFLRAYIFWRERFNPGGQSRVNCFELHWEELQIFCSSHRSSQLAGRQDTSLKQAVDRDQCTDILYLDLVLKGLDVIDDLVEDKSFAYNLISFQENQSRAEGEKQIESDRRWYLITTGNQVL